MRTKCTLLVAIAALGCGKSRNPYATESDESSRPSPKPVPIDAAPPVQVPAHAMLCHGKEDFVWMPDGTTAKLDPRLVGLFTGLDGHLYTRGFRSIETVGDTKTIPLEGGGPGGDFNYRLVVKSPTSALAWTDRDDKAIVLEYQNGAWKTIPNLPAPKDADDRFVGATFGADGKLWVARGSGVWVRYEGDTFTQVTMKLGSIFAMAATPGGVYIGTNSELVRFDPQAATTLATYQGYTHDISTDAHGHVATIVDGSGTGGTLILASDTAPKATKTKLATSLFTRLAIVDAAGRAWVMVRGELIAFSPDGTTQAYPRGAFADMPQRDRGCEPLGDGFATLPKPGAFTGELRLDIHGGAGLKYEVCNDPSATSRASACGDEPGLQSGTLDSGGSAVLHVPTGYYVPAVQQNGEWLVPDYSSGSINQTAGWCDVTATSPCTVQVQVGD